MSKGTHGEGKGSPLQHSRLEHPTGRGPRGHRDSDTTDLARGCALPSPSLTGPWQLPVLISGSLFEFHPHVHSPLRLLHLCADSDPGQGCPVLFTTALHPSLSVCGGAGVTGLVAGWAQRLLALSGPLARLLSGWAGGVDRVSVGVEPPTRGVVFLIGRHVVPASRS